MRNGNNSGSIDWNVTVRVFEDIISAAETAANVVSMSEGLGFRV
jgi:hypothetical protein